MKKIIAVILSLLLTGCAFVKEAETETKEDESLATTKNIEEEWEKQKEYNIESIEDEEKKNYILKSDQELELLWEESFDEGDVPKATYSIPKEYQLTFSNYIKTDRAVKIGDDISLYNNEPKYKGYIWTRLSDTICRANYSLTESDLMMTIKVGSNNNFNKIISVYYSEITDDMELFSLDNPVTNVNTYDTVSEKIGEPYAIRKSEDGLFGIWYNASGRKYTIEFDEDENIASLLCE